MRNTDLDLYWRNYFNISQDICEMEEIINWPSLSSPAVRKREKPARIENTLPLYTPNDSQNNYIKPANILDRTRLRKVQCMFVWNVAKSCLIYPLYLLLVESTCSISVWHLKPACWLWIRRGPVSVRDVAGTMSFSLSISLFWKLCCSAWILGILT